MWLRRLVLALGPARELSVDTPAAVVWKDLPDDVVLQLHWPPADDLTGLLAEHGFATVVLARHPLDVLVSILQFAQFEGRTARWLNGAGGNELGLVGAGPCSDAFRAYATSERATRLLEVTPLWWASGRLDARARYEDLVARPAEELTRLAHELGLGADAVDAAVATTTIDALRAETASAHFWRGHPGLWRSLLPAEVAGEIAAAHAPVLNAGGYDADPDPELTEAAAEARWRELTEGGRPRRLPPGPGEDGRLAVHLASAVDDPGLLVDRLYALAVRRRADERGRQEAMARLEQHQLSAATLLHELVTSAEGRAARRLDDATTFASWARSVGERPRGLVAPGEATEELVAIPWALARAVGVDALLDVGSAYAEPAYLAALRDLGAERLVLADPAPPEVPGFERVRADVRDLPFASGTFDVALCLGTLHHVGCDNRPYGLPAEHDPDGPLDALRELRRVLSGTGRLFVSVPCGDAQDLGLFRQQPAERWLELFARSGYAVFEHETYVLDHDGWRTTDALPPGIRYGERGAGAGGVLCAELRADRLRQAMRRAARRVRA
jgi:SAM-dependent methyltransferase